MLSDAELLLVECAKRLNLSVSLLRKNRSVGIVPSSPTIYEASWRRQEAGVSGVGGRQWAFQRRQGYRRAGRRQWWVQVPLVGEKAGRAETEKGQGARGALKARGQTSG